MREHFPEPHYGSFLIVSDKASAGPQSICPGLVIVRVFPRSPSVIHVAAIRSYAVLHMDPVHQVSSPEAYFRLRVFSIKPFHQVGPVQIPGCLSSYYVISHDFPVFQKSLSKPSICILENSSRSVVSMLWATMDMRLSRMIQ